VGEVFRSSIGHLMSSMERNAISFATIIPSFQICNVVSPGARVILSVCSLRKPLALAEKLRLQ